MSKTIRTLKQRNTPIIWLLLLSSIIFFVPSFLMNKIWFDLEKVEVIEPAVDDGQIEMNVERTIINSFRGYYIVRIKNFEGVNNEPICEGRPLAPFQYNPKRDLPKPLTLSWWIGSKAKLEICRKNGFKVGNQYRIQTCHTVVWTVWNLPIARRCVISNVFTLVADEST